MTQIFAVFVKKWFWRQTFTSGIEVLGQNDQFIDKGSKKGPKRATFSIKIGQYDLFSIKMTQKGLLLASKWSKRATFSIKMVQKRVLLASKWSKKGPFSIKMVQKGSF